MLINSNITVKNNLKKLLVSAIMISVAFLTFASMGGGKKSKTNTVKNDFIPIRTSNGFTLKSGPLYRGSSIIGQERNKTSLTLNSVLTYQKGNTTFIMPYKQRIVIPPCNTNANNSLQLLNLKVRMHK